MDQCKWCQKEIYKDYYCNIDCKVNYLEKAIYIIEEKLKNHSVLHLREKGLDVI